MSIDALSKGRAAEVRDEWVAAVRQLAADVTRWAEEQGWSVIERAAAFDEQGIGAYEAPVLEISTPGGQLLLEPVAREVLGGHGRVDLSAYPLLRRVILIRSTDDRQWEVHTDFGPRWPNPWGPSTFVQLASELAREP